jgi:ribosomal protein S18 acetylase RimI-like enzyme
MPMLRINRLRVEIKTANKSYGGVYGFDERFSDGLNFIASIENTAGKSSIIEAIFYCLGFEEIIGGRNEKVLTSVYKSQIKDADNDWLVLESSAFLEISNGSETVTLYRAAKMEGRDPRLITVYYGNYDSIGIQSTSPEDMYLHDGGAATNEKGFHSFLESFLHLQLPMVQTGGNDQKLYLQIIFSCLFIEQKHGWADIFSGMPYFAIKDAKKRAVEFLLGLSTLKNEKEKDRLKLIKDAITTEWKSIVDDIVRGANRESCSVSGLFAQPRIMEERDYKAVFISTVYGKSLNDVITELNAEHDAIKKLTPRIIDNFDVLNKELHEVEGTANDYEKKLLECEHQISLSRSAMNQAEKSLEVVVRDLLNNKDAAKLQRMGSITGCQASSNVCPTCNQQIQDSLLHIGDNIPIMSVDENIRHLEGQESILEFTRDSHRTNIDQLTLVKNDLQSRLLTLRRLAQTIRSDIYSTETEWSESVVQKLVENETKIMRYEQLQAFVSLQMEAIAALSIRWKEYKEAYARLPTNTISDIDFDLIKTLKKNFIANLRKYKYKSAPNIDAVDIPIDTCLPTIDGFDMKFDSSASDNIRIIWSFTMALLQTSIQKRGNHPGLIIFDEPAQHSIVTSDMESLIQSVLDLKESSQVIMGITLNNEEVRKLIENLPKNHATFINVGERAFNLIDKLHIRQARLSEFPFMQRFLHEAFMLSSTSEPSRGLLDEPMIYAYIDNFGEYKDDICFIAKKNGDVIGMAWVRICKSYGYIDDQTPELVVCILPDYRSKGIGTELLSILLNNLREEGYKQVSISVRKSNPATRLLLRLGYKIVKENEHDYLMIKDLS